jgi:hypothetical protein
MMRIWRCIDYRHLLHLLRYAPEHLQAPVLNPPCVTSPVRTSSTTSMRHESCKSAFVGRHLFFDVVIGRVRLHVMVIFFLIWVPPFIILPNSQRNAFIKHGGQAVHKRHSCQNTLHALPAKLFFFTARFQFFPLIGLMLTCLMNNTPHVTPVATACNVSIWKVS